MSFYPYTPTNTEAARWLHQARNALRRQGRDIRGGSNRVAIETIYSHGGITPADVDSICQTSRSVAQDQAENLLYYLYIYNGRKWPRRTTHKDDGVFSDVELLQEYVRQMDEVASMRKEFLENGSREEELLIRDNAAKRMSPAQYAQWLNKWKPAYRVTRRNWNQAAVMTVGKLDLDEVVEKSAPLLREKKVRVSNRPIDVKVHQRERQAFSEKKLFVAYESGELKTEVRLANNARTDKDLIRLINIFADEYFPYPDYNSFPSVSRAQAAQKTIMDLRDRFAQEVVKIDALSRVLFKSSLTHIDDETRQTIFGHVLQTMEQRTLPEKQRRLLVRALEK